MLATVHKTHLSQFRSPILEHPEQAMEAQALSQDRVGQCICFHLSPCLTSHSDTEVRSGGQSNPVGPLVTLITVVPTAMSVFGPPSHHPVPPGPPVTTWVGLGWQVLPSGQAIDLLGPTASQIAVFLYYSL